MKNLNVVVERVNGCWDGYLDTDLSDMHPERVDYAYLVQAHVLHLVRLMRHDGQHVNVKYDNMLAPAESYRFSDLHTVQEMENEDFRIIIGDTMTEEQETDNNIFYHVGEHSVAVSHIGRGVWNNFCLTEFDEYAICRLTEEAIENTEYVDDINVTDIDMFIIAPHEAPSKDYIG